ncbi:MAG: hypothetical protein NW215_01205 [Hyphomicrobiales bacterium]|nr:hypothetical protein [Hyphomicrobiales bacterium]
MLRTLFFAVIIAAFGTAPAVAQSKPASLYKIVLADEEIVVGFNERELTLLGGDSPAVIAGALAKKSEFTVWRYAVRKAPNGDLQYAPLKQVGLIAGAVKRVEAYRAAIPVLSHD